MLMNFGPEDVPVSFDAYATFRENSFDEATGDSVIALLTNIGLNLIIVLPMMHFGVPGPHAGLALATGLAAGADVTVRELTPAGWKQTYPGPPESSSRARSR